MDNTHHGDYTHHGNHTSWTPQTEWTTHQDTQTSCTPLHHRTHTSLTATSWKKLSFTETYMADILWKHHHGQRLLDDEDLFFELPLALWRLWLLTNLPLDLHSERRMYSFWTTWPKWKWKLSYYLSVFDPQHLEDCFGTSFETLSYDGTLSFWLSV